MKEIKGIKLTEKLETYIKESLNINENEKIGPREVSEADGYYVPTYRELVEQVAILSYINEEYLLFFRGQKSDHKKLNSNRSTFYPTIYRGRLSERDLSDRFETLNIASEKFQKILEEKSFENIDELKRKEYIRWSILQHYEVTDTPLIDITQSLQVACSFAQLKDTEGDVFVYVFGLPYYINRISHNSEQNLINIRLLSICHPQALRPYFQEGFLVGTEDITYNYGNDKEELDLNNRLIAKFKIPNNTEFWGSEFKKIPKEALYPSKDQIAEICNTIRDEIDVKILAIPLRRESAQDIIGSHQNKIYDENLVYFSTSIRIDKEKAKKQSYLLLYNKECMYLCKINNYYEKDNKKFIPDDSTKYSPKEFSKKEEKHWFLLSTIKELDIKDKDKLKNFMFVNNEVNKNVYEYIEKSGRLQPFYLKGWFN